MKLSYLLVATVFTISLFTYCHNDSKESQAPYQYEKADSTVANQYISSSAALENSKDSTRKFIRTAEMKFKVQSVVNATYAIEDITNQMNGFVTFTKLNSHQNYKNSIAISADSSLETTYFTVSNDMTLRVPNTKLDTTLKAISKLIDYLDYRIIKADDVALSLLSNQLTQERSSKNEKRLKAAIENQGKKLQETTSAEEILADMEEKSDNSKIANLSLYDQINFCTITLSIYQRQTIFREVISNDKNIDAFTPSLGKRVLEALKKGWNLLESLMKLRGWWGHAILPYC